MKDLTIKAKVRLTIYKAIEGEYMRSLLKMLILSTLTSACGVIEESVEDNLTNRSSGSTTNDYQSPNAYSLNDGLYKIDAIGYNCTIDGIGYSGILTLALKEMFVQIQTKEDEGYSIEVGGDVFIYDEYQEGYLRFGCETGITKFNSILDQYGNVEQETTESLCVAVESDIALDSNNVVLNKKYNQNSSSYLYLIVDSEVVGGDCQYTYSFKKE